jgi:hypothetical protein
VLIGECLCCRPQLIVAIYSAGSAAQRAEQVSFAHLNRDIIIWCNSIRLPAALTAGIVPAKAAEGFGSADFGRAAAK